MRGSARLEWLAASAAGALLLIGSCGPQATTTGWRPAEAEPTTRATIGSALTLPVSVDNQTMLVLESIRVEVPGIEQTPVAQAVTATVVAHGEPDERSTVISTFSNPTRPGVPLVFQAVGPIDDGWIEVLLPIRPNGTTGWIRSEDVTVSYNPYRIDVDVDAHRMTVFRDGDEILTTTVAIGTGDTPTPLGNFYLIELLRTNDESGPYGPYAYGLSGYSETLTTFNGGEGIIGIHGTNRPDLLGNDVSHGCIRVPNDIIVGMTDYLPLGTPINIG